MKEVLLKNIFNHELFKCTNLKDVAIIDGIEYLRVKKEGQAKLFLMRKDSLIKVAKSVS